MRGSVRTRVAVISSSTGPLNCTTSSSPCRRTSQAERGERGQRSPRLSTRQAPVMRRCEWMTSPPSKRSRRCLPTASTASTRRPARRSGQRSRPKRGMRRRDLVGDVTLQHGADAPRARGGWCRPQASPGASAKSCRPRRKPRATRRSASGLATAGSPSMVSTHQPAQAARRGRRRRARPGPARRPPARPSTRSERPPACTREHRAAGDRDQMGAGAARRRPDVGVRPAQPGPVELRRVGGGDHQRRLRRLLLGAQPLHGPRQGELRAAQPLDEVAAAGRAERLERR